METNSYLAATDVQMKLIDMRIGDQPCEESPVEAGRMEEVSLD